MEKEFWDLYDQNRQDLGKTLEVGQIVPPDTYHLVVHAAIFNSEGKLLIRKRTVKTRFPGLWAETMNGCVKHNETSLEALDRELKEQLGIDQTGDLKPTFTTSTLSAFNDFYVMRRDIDPDKLRSSPTQQFRYADKEEIKEMIANKEFIPLVNHFIDNLFYYNQGELDKVIEVPGSLIPQKYQLDSFPIIVKSHSQSYGASQNWYPSKWSRESGCGSIAATNLILYYNLALSSEKKEYPYDEVLELMKEIFKIFRPTIFGYTNYRKFARQFIKYAKKENKTFSYELYKPDKHSENSLDFVRRSLSAKDPVAILILTHSQKSLGIFWHWMVITGINADNQIEVSNHGNFETYPAYILFDTGWKTYLRMVRFHAG